MSFGNCRKWRLRDPKFQNFGGGGVMPPVPPSLERLPLWIHSSCAYKISRYAPGNDCAVQEPCALNKVISVNCISTGNSIVSAQTNLRARYFKIHQLRGCPFKNRPLDFRPKTEFLQIFRVRLLVHMINKKGNNLAFNAIFQYFWRQFHRTVQNP